jgi:hypothetical protein
MKDKKSYKGSVDPLSKEHWQKDVSDSVFQRGYGNDPAGAFLPRPGKDRAVPHKKINECDH